MPENSGDAVDRAVNAMVRLEPSLKGRESQVAVIVVAAMADYLKERGEPSDPYAYRVGTT